MSSRFRVSCVAIGVAALALGACDREERHNRSKPLGETVPAGESPDTIYPGNGVPPPLDARAAMYDNNAPAIAQGQWLYTQMNCVGCHSHGGGGMGPPLMDDEWRYGGRIDQIAATIAEGRPNGMPAWRGKLTDQQAWQLSAYVRALSGNVRKDAAPSRRDAMAATPPLTQMPRQPPRSGDDSAQTVPSP
jgi:cytochrome c oxidase cbb3-type subunit III